MVGKEAVTHWQVVRRLAVRSSHFTALHVKKQRKEKVMMFSNVSMMLMLGMVAVSTVCGCKSIMGGNTK